MASLENAAALHNFTSFRPFAGKVIYPGDGVVTIGFAWR